MDNQWQRSTIEPHNDAIAQLRHLYVLLTDSPELLFSGLGSLSMKSEGLDPFGDPLAVLNYMHQSTDQIPYRLADLKRVPTVKDSSLLERAFGHARLQANCVLPHLNTVLHALIPDKIVVFCMPTPMLALDLLDNAAEEFKAIFGESVRFLKKDSDLELARAFSALKLDSSVVGIFVHRYGFFTFGEDVESVYGRIAALTTKVEDTFDHSRQDLLYAFEDEDYSKSQRETLAGLRKSLAESAGTPVLMQNFSDPRLIEIVKDEAIIHVLNAGPLTTYQADTFINGFLHISKLPESLPTSNALMDPELGLLITGQTAINLKANLALVSITLQAALLASSKGPLSIETIQPGPPPEPIVRSEHDKDFMFIGEIALVTGAASGIGRGCALSLLERGAVVIGMDINDDIDKVSDSMAYLGLVCDLTDETAVAVAFEKAVRSFGGLDMVVLNAGIFTKSALVKELDLAMWQKVMRINLDANVTILRESYPLLKQAPADGRVLVNASRNVPAPGPGAAAYSTSKAALTQLARVAALEWGADHIRVNMIHPHAVFDTGIWTDEVLKSRAEKYGVTVQEYKTRNVLKVELTSRDIGELVCEMLGPVFSKTTGAQVPVDGGCDRVI